MKEPADMKVFYLDNVAAHYRKAIFLLMDKTFRMDYLFGASLGDIKTMDTSVLKGNVYKTQTIFLIGKWYWQHGLVSKLAKEYDRYLLVGETRALSTWWFCILACLIGKKKKIFFWTHGWYGKENRLEKFLKKLYFGMAGGGIFLYGNYARDLMIKEGFNPDKLFTIHNSLDYEHQIKIRKGLQSSSIYQDHFCNSNNNLVFIGRLTPEKKLDMILMALQSCKKEGHIINMTYIGDGEKKEELQSQTKELGLDSQVWFYGPSYDDEVLSELIYNADLCVAPGNVGLTAMHSMVFGTPVITHNRYSYQMPEFEAIKEGITGDFFEYNDIDSLSNSIQEWLMNNNDRDAVRQACFKEIDEQWTPQFQIEVLKNNLC